MEEFGLEPNLWVKHHDKAETYTKGLNTFFCPVNQTGVLATRVLYTTEKKCKRSIRNLLTTGAITECQPCQGLLLSPIYFKYQNLTVNLG